ncbi:MAG: hypothetical protein C0602_01355, partial [Denitrovibrio sp.]
MFHRLKLFDFVDAALIAVNNSIVIYFNNKAAEYFDLSDKDYYKVKYTDILPGLDISEEIIQKVYTDNKTFQVAPKVLTDVDMEGVVLLTVSDITENLETRRDMIHANERCYGLETALNSITDEIFITDSKGFTEYVNSAVERI